jgi:uncharacterized integral membrane protein
VVEGAGRHSEALISATVEFQSQRLDHPDRRLQSRAQRGLDDSTSHRPRYFRRISSRHPGELASRLEGVFRIERFAFMRDFKLIVASCLAILVAIIVVQNRDPVATHLLFATLSMPLAILLFITAAAGFALGVLLTMSLSKRNQNR